VEQEVRAMLHRRSTDVTPDRPSWDSITIREPRPLAPSNGRGWARPLAAAASVVVLVTVGAVVLNRLSGGSPPPEAAVGSDPDDDAPVLSEGDSVVVPAPGTVDFDRATALSVYPAIGPAGVEELAPGDVEHLEGDPVDAARTYLAEASIEQGQGAVDTLEVEIADDSRDPATSDDEDDGDEGLPDPEVSVAWSTWAETQPPISSGHVYLRRAEVSGDDGDVAHPWLVVGARTEGIRLTDVRRDDERLSFTISRASDTTQLEQVRVEVDGAPVSVDVPSGAALPVDVEVDGPEVAVIRVQHLDPTTPEGEGRRPISIVEMAVPHPEDVEHHPSVAR
jgi:hypothetical protein